MASMMAIYTASIHKPNVWFKIAESQPILATPYRIQQSKIKNLQPLVSVNKETRRKPLTLSAKTSGDNSDINLAPFSPANTLVLFYSAINEKNLKQLDNLIAEDCSFEDYTFTKIFQGKKEVLHFLKQLISCMGQNMQFYVDHICEGNDFTAAVNWHLEWNAMQVPFTRGCSCYSLSIDGDNLIIKKARVLVESPIKLGGVALAAFKIVAYIFDAFPAGTEWFLKSPHVIFHLLLNTYNMIIKPIINPFVSWYIKLLNILACILTFTLKILSYLAKLFHT